MSLIFLFSGIVSAFLIFHNTDFFEVSQPAASRAREPQLLSPCATATEARSPRARAMQQEKPLQWEARAPQRRGAPALRS